MYSEYYEKSFDIAEDEKEALLDIYEEIAEEKGFEPDYEDRDLVNFEEDGELLDTILYHVENFGKDKVGFGMIEYLFEEETEVEEE